MPLVPSAGAVIDRIMSVAATGSSVTTMLACASACSKPGYWRATANPAGGKRVTLVPGTRTLWANDGTVTAVTTPASASVRITWFGIYPHRLASGMPPRRTRCVDVGVTRCVRKRATPTTYGVFAGQMQGCDASYTDAHRAERVVRTAVDLLFVPESRSDREIAQRLRRSAGRVGPGHVGTN